MITLRLKKFTVCFQYGHEQTSKLLCRTKTYDVGKAINDRGNDQQKDKWEPKSDGTQSPVQSEHVNNEGSTYVKNLGRFQFNLHVIRDKTLDEGLAVPANVQLKGMGTQVADFIEQVLNLDDVRKAQEHVINIRSELIKASDEKRSLLRQLTQIRDDLSNIVRLKYSKDRTATSRLQILEEEMELFKKEGQLQEAFDITDDREQTLMRQLTTAINVSYEKEKMHQNLLKILGIFGTIFGSLLTAIVSIAGYMLNQQKFDSLREVETSLSKHAGEIAELTKSMHSNRYNETTSRPSESWGAYFKRQMRWVLPKN